MKLYLAGKISGDPNAFDKFMNGAHELRIRGHEVINPVELNFDRPEWKVCMRRDIAALMTCDAICTFSDWTKSPGARIEVRIAAEVSIPAFDYNEMVKPLSRLEVAMRDADMKELVKQSGETIAEGSGAPRIQYGGLPPFPSGASFLPGMVTRSTSGFAATVSEAAPITKEQWDGLNSGDLAAAMMRDGTGS